MAERSIERLRDNFKKTDRVAIIIVPDPDSIASAMAFHYLFSEFVQIMDIIFIKPTNRPDNQTMISIMELHYKMIKDTNVDDYNKKVMLDGQPEHRGETKDLHFDVIIDHHPRLRSSKALFLDIRPYHSANSTIMAEYVKDSGKRLTEKLATALYYGILTDTDNFRRVKDVRYIGIIVFLLPKVNIERIRFIEGSEICRSKIPVIADALGNIVFKKDCAFDFIPDIADEDLIVTIADFLLRIKGVSVSAVCCVYDELFILVLRSWLPNCNVGELAERFAAYGNGGGHQFAARVEIPLKNLPEKYKPIISGSAFQFVNDIIGSYIFQEFSKPTYASDLQAPCGIDKFS